MLIKKCFIDDIFVIWTGCKTEVISYMTKIDRIHKTIKLTHELSYEELTFLGTMTYKGNIQTAPNCWYKAHIKQTNKN